MRDEVLEFLRQNQGSFVSGQDMSEACHVSRTAIWKHIKALRQKGYKIESYTKRGYRLLEEPDLLSPLAMKQILKDIQDGTFAKDFLLDMSQAGGQAHFKAMRKLASEHPSEKVGEEIRKLYSWNGEDKLINN